MNSSLLQVSILAIFDLVVGCFGEVDGEHEFCGENGRGKRVRNEEEERKKG